MHHPAGHLLAAHRPIVMTPRSAPRIALWAASGTGASLRPMASFDNAIFLWREGERRLADAPPHELPALERVAERIFVELRRRLGAAFTADELAELYDRGTDWCLDVAYATAPEAPYAWDLRTVADAAFARYLREATDYAGGRRLEARP